MLQSQPRTAARVPDALTAAIVEAKRVHSIVGAGPGRIACNCGEQLAGDNQHELHDAHFAAALVAVLGLAEERRWTPVDEDGHRWEPRDEGLALAAAQLYGRGSPLNPPGMAAVDHVEVEARWRTQWRRVDA